MRFGAFVFDPASGRLTRDGAEVALGVTETGLLRALAARAGEAVTRAALSAETGVAERSIDVGVARLRRKIEPDPRAPGCIATVRGVGYVLRAAQ